MPFGNKPKDEEPRKYGPDTERPRDLVYNDLPWNHQLNVTADIARGTRKEAIDSEAERNSAGYRMDISSI